MLGPVPGVVEWLGLADGARPVTDLFALSEPPMVADALRATIKRRATGPMAGSPARPMAGSRARSRVDTEQHRGGHRPGAVRLNAAGCDRFAPEQRKQAPRALLLRLRVHRGRPDHRAHLDRCGG